MKKIVFHKLCKFITIKINDCLKLTIHITLNLFISNFFIAQVKGIKSNYCPPIEMKELATAGNVRDCEATVDFKGATTSGSSFQGAIVYNGIMNYYRANYPGGPNGIIKSILNSRYWYISRSYLYKYSPDAIGFRGRINYNSVYYDQYYWETFEFNFSKVLPPGTYTIKLWQAFNSYYRNAEDPFVGSSRRRIKIYDIFAIPEKHPQCSHSTRPGSSDIDFYDRQRPIVSYYTDHNEPDFTEKSFKITLNEPVRGLLFTTKFAVRSYPFDISKSAFNYICDYYITFGNVDGAQITISGTPDADVDDRTIPPTPKVPNQSYCAGSLTPVLEVKNPDMKKYTYNWYQGSTKIKDGVQLDCSQLSPPVTSGSFTVTATDKTTGCVSKATTVKLIKFSDLQVEKVNTCLSQTIVKPSGGRPPYEYSLDGVAFQSSPIFKGDFRRAHTLYVRDFNGCEVREEAKGFSFDLYGVFSPNGDGINDRWDLSALSGCVKVRVKIFDRYGRYIHQMGWKNLSWDGKVRGKAMPSGTYWYVIDFNDGITPVLKGNLTIKRRKD